VLQKRQGSTARFDWHSAAYSLHVPMISALFEQIAQPSKLRALNLEETLDWTSDALNRVDASAFFTKFQAEHSVQYFYEPFLQAFDPALRKELGVWYTPEEIVRYQVARVDAVLQSELGLPDGLADPNVVVLDRLPRRSAAPDCRQAQGAGRGCSVRARTQKSRHAAFLRL
jgi:predicted helicase